MRSFVKPVQILDPCCGAKMMYFKKSDPRVLFCDIRHENHALCNGEILEIDPDLLCDFQALPFPDSAFSLVVFDPPHVDNAGLFSWVCKKYGRLDKRTWRQELRHGFSECWRVLKAPGTLIFKWSERRFSNRQVLAVFRSNPFLAIPPIKNPRTGSRFLKAPRTEKRWRSLPGPASPHMRG